MPIVLPLISIPNKSLGAQPLNFFFFTKSCPSIALREQARARVKAMSAVAFVKISGVLVTIMFLLFA
jgi:hypothetical protein